MSGRFANLARKFIVRRVADVIVEQLERLPGQADEVLREIIEEVRKRLEKKTPPRKHVENES